MQGVLTEYDYAHLRARFIVPLIAADMIEDVEILDDVAEYAIHDILSEFKPDAALLCIALCAQSIAQTDPENYMAKLLQMEAGQLLDEYAPVWLDHERQCKQHGATALPLKDVHDLIRNIPEDLETLAQMLEDYIAVAGDDHAIPAILADILSLQASMHRDLALVELQTIGAAPDEIFAQAEAQYDAYVSEGLTADERPALNPKQEQLLESGDNVVLFPGNKTVN
jgi:hypothetical protein